MAVRAAELHDAIQMELESSSSLSQDSVASLTAGDVLIRSTGVHREKPIEAVAAAGGRVTKVPVAVKKLREVSPCQAADAASTGRRTPCVPPALSASRTPCREVAPDTLRSASSEGSSTKGHPEHLIAAENSPMDYPREAAAQEDSSLLVEDSRRPKDDVFISQYATGQKEALRAVLKQKTQHAPVPKQVKVQFLGNAHTEKKESAGPDTRSAHHEADSATTIAAATAAAIATTAPLLKVQNDLEAKVNSVSALIHKLQETDRHLQSVAEQQTNKKTQHEEPHCHERVHELEKQMNAFMVQRIQHLEKLQEQQMKIQSHLISSAVNSGGLQQIPVPFSSLMAKQPEKPEQQLLMDRGPSYQRDLFPTTTQACSSQFPSHAIHTQKSPPRTPVPRRCAPEPVSKNVTLSNKGNPVTAKENVHKSTDAGTVGEGSLRERVLCSQGMPLKQTESSEETALKSNKMSWHSERDRHTALHPDGIPALESSSQNASSVEKTVKKADDLLEDLGHLRQEMHNMLQEANTWKLDMNELIKLKKPTAASDLPEDHQLNKPSILQSVKVPTSILSDAERILRGVQTNRRVLDENLEAIVRAKDADAMYAFINAFTAHRDVLEEVRIRRTVDEWIKTISEEIQAEMARNDSKQVNYDQKVPWIKRAQNIKAMKTNREIKERNKKTQGCSTKKPLSAAKSLQKQAEDNRSKQKCRAYFSSDSLQRKEERAAVSSQGPVSGSAVAQNEDYLQHVYGKPIYQGHRSTLKKAPYLRFNSPSPKSKVQRPKVIECVRGTKVKSARTQTCSHTQKVVTSPRKQLPLYPLARENKYLFSPSQDVPAECGPLEGHLIPMAIPLGQTQISDTSLLPAGVVIGKPHPVTVTTSLPQVPPKPVLEVKKPNIAVIEMRSEKKDPPQLSVQVLPSVDIDSVSSDGGSVNHILPGSEPACAPVKAVIQPPEDLHSEEEDTKFPGNNFIDVTDVMQDQEEERDEIPEFCEPLLELNGQFKVASPKYNGPLFPPVASTPQQSSDVLDELIQRRETIENKLINWVEQEIMAKIISGMCPVQKETVPSVNTSESEDSEAATSDIVEFAGGRGFQLFINAGLPVDSDMISHLVNEALSETIATMLGNRQAETAVPATNVLPSTTITVDSHVPTPLPTPQATPPQTPPSEKELPPVKTPESSLSLTERSGNIQEPEKTKETGVKIPAAPARVGTPVVTPVNTPPRTATPSPPSSECISKDANMASPKLPNPWDDAELPLEEEKPIPEELFHPKAVEMSVANDEEPEALILPPQQSSPKVLESLPADPQVPPGSSEQSTQESSITLTETETEDRPISEGEVLFSYGQVLAEGALAEGGLSLPNHTESLTSTLRDANEMDSDPPSEGQVVRRPGKGFHRDPVLILLAKLNQAPGTAQEGMYHLEDSDDSVGELSEGQRPRLAKAAERILGGHSVCMNPPTAQTSESRPHQAFRSLSPGQLGQTADLLGDADTNHGPLLMAELESQPVSNPDLHSAQLSCSVTSVSEDLSQELSQGAAEVEAVRPRVIHVRSKSGGTQQEGDALGPHLNPGVSAAKMSVKLPYVDTDNQPESVSSAHSTSDSSGKDTF
ncbi:protein TALPID3 isoform X3 [Pogoniulus pusillus]|uniref:protein TALPID3 isoform X3 n=1 Tax=Pogoniulus pusillus TaxID=488313 RepID=UPI0030B9246F